MGIRWPVSPDCIAGSSVQPTEVLNLSTGHIKALAWDFPVVTSLSVNK